MSDPTPQWQHDNETAVMQDVYALGLVAPPEELLPYTNYVVRYGGAAIALRFYPDDEHALTAEINASTGEHGGVRIYVEGDLVLGDEGED